MTLLPKCLCGSYKFMFGFKHQVPVMTCTECGVVRQNVPMTPEQYAAFYDRYYEDTYTHSYADDLRVAKLRFYAHRPKGRVLDVGSGTGTFVAVCRGHGLEAWGQDVAPIGTNSRTYRGELETIHFPTAWADTVTMHDVIEHLVDPVATLKELSRIIRPGGRLIIDLPLFHEDTGRHHWKLIEHIWLLRPEQLERLLYDAGFDMQERKYPISGKVVIYAERRAVRRPTILVPPGIGDIYWVMVKMRSFIEKRGIDLPSIYIDAPDGKRRAFEFVQRIPFVHAAGYHDPKEMLHPGDVGARRRERHRGYSARMTAYTMDGPNVFADVEGMDWFISFNGSMDAGRGLHEIDMRYPPDWDIPFFVSIPERLYGENLRTAIGNYVVAAFFSGGFYKKWLEEVSPEILYKYLQRFDRTVVLTGAAWDIDSDVNKRLLELDEGKGMFVNLLGKTMLYEYFGALRSADACIGFPAGNMMMGPAFGVPTTIIWNDHFDRRFHFNACRPGTDYTILNTKELI